MDSTQSGAPTVNLSPRQVGSGDSVFCGCPETGRNREAEKTQRLSSKVPRPRLGDCRGKGEPGQGRWGTRPVLGRSRHRERQKVFPGASDEPSSVPRGGPGLWLGCLLCTSSHLLASRVNGFPAPSSLRGTTEQPQLWSHLIHCFSPSPTPAHFRVYSPKSLGRNAVGVSGMKQNKTKNPPKPNPLLGFFTSLVVWAPPLEVEVLMTPTGGDLGRHPCPCPLYWQSTRKEMPSCLECQRRQVWWCYSHQHKNNIYCKSFELLPICQTQSKRKLASLFDHR